MTKKYPIGVVHGRFQPLHKDHLKFILVAFERAELMYVGITNPDASLTAADKADSNRSQLSANPCTYYERLEMVRLALMEAGIAQERFRVVPFPINFPELLPSYCPATAVFFHTIYDAWGDRKLELMQRVGLQVELLWKKPESEKGISASQIRKAIVANRPWQHMVPESVAQYLVENNIDDRIRAMNAG